MAARIGDLARHTGVYGVGTVVGGIARVALVPVIARYVPTDEYGKASIVFIFITLMTIVSELGLSSSLIKFYNEAESEDQRRRTVATIIVASLMLALPVAAVCLLFTQKLSVLLLGSPRYSVLILIGIAGGLGNAVLQVGLSFERALARSRRYVVYTLIKGGLALALSITLVVLLRKGAVGLVLGSALPPLVIGVVIYGQLIRRFAVGFSKSIFSAVFHFGSPLVPMNLAMWVLTYSDIYLLRRLTVSGALSEVGLYQYAHEICLVMVLPITAFNLAWPQFLFSHHSKPGAPDMFARVHVYFTFLLVGIGFLLSLFSYGIIRLVGSAQYADSSEVMPYLAGSLVFYGTSIVFASGLYATGKTRVLAAVVAMCAVLNIGLNLVLIPRMGKQGAALATLVTNVIMAFVILAFAQGRYRIPFRLRRGILAVVAAVAVVGAYGLLDIPDLGGGLALRAAAACGFGFVLLRILGMSYEEARSGLRMLTSLVKPSSRR